MIIAAVSLGSRWEPLTILGTGGWVGFKEGGGNEGWQEPTTQVGRRLVERWERA